MDSCFMKVGSFPGALGVHVAICLPLYRISEKLSRFWEKRQMHIRCADSLVSYGQKRAVRSSLFRACLHKKYLRISERSQLPEQLRTPVPAVHAPYCYSIIFIFHLIFSKNSESVLIRLLCAAQQDFITVYDIVQQILC